LFVDISGSSCVAVEFGLVVVDLLLFVVCLFNLFEFSFVGFYVGCFVDLCVCFWWLCMW